MAEPATETTVARPGGPGGRTRERADQGKALGNRLVDAFLVRREASILLVAIALVVYFQSSSEQFLTETNIRTLAQFIAAAAIIAAGEVMLMILGEIDLSVGMVFALSAFIMTFAMDAGLPFLVAVVVALAVAATIGFVNGGVTVWFKVPSFITTLGTLFLLNGLTLTLSNGTPRETPEQSAATNLLGQSPYAGIVWAIVIVCALQVVLRQTRWGLHTIAAGGNPIGAAEAGIRTARVRIGNFMLCSALAGFVGIMEALRIQSVDPLAGGTNIMFLAIASAVIGGTALSGGAGTVFGAFIGAIVLAVLRNGFTLQGVNAFTFDLILGIAILLSMILNVYLGQLRKAGRV
jgi:simple sugar transport system permease protein